MMRRSRFAFTFAGLAALVAFTACGEPPTSHTGEYPAAASHADEDAPQVGHFEVCKEGTDATFQVSIDGGPPTTVDIADGNCQVVATVSRSVASVSVTEVVGSNMELVQIVRDSFWVDDDGAVGGSMTLTGTNTVSGDIYGDVGFIATFQNRPVSGGGGEGCTPGYWKQRHHLDSWEGHAPSDVLSDAGFTPRPPTSDRSTGSGIRT